MEEEDGGGEAADVFGFDDFDGCCDCITGFEDIGHIEEEGFVVVFSGFGVEEVLSDFFAIQIYGGVPIHGAEVEDEALS